MNELLQDQIMIAPWMDEEDLTFRSSAPDNLKKILEQNLLLGGEYKVLGVFARGVSSVVYKIASTSGIFVLKMSRKPEVISNEVFFLESWKQQGLTVPTVVSTHQADVNIPVSFSVMEYISAPILSDALGVEEIINQGISREIGRMLSQMHQATGIGFGVPKIGAPDKGTFTTLREDFESVFDKTIPTLIAAGIINADAEQYCRVAIEVLEEDLKKNKKSPVLIHGDLRPYNIFHTDPLTIFDPNPKISHQAVDLGTCLLRAVSESEEFGARDAEEVLAGYKEKTLVDDKILAAGVVLVSLRLARNWLRKDRKEKVERAIHFFGEHTKKL